MISQLSKENQGHYPNLRKVLEMRAGQLTTKSNQTLRIRGQEGTRPTTIMDWEDQPNVEWGKTEMGGTNGPRIDEVMTYEDPIGGGQQNRDQNGNIRWNYIIEPPDSPSESGSLITLPTGLSPLMQKVNLKRKFEDESDSEKEDRVQQAVKKHKGQAQGGDGRNLKSNTTPKGRKQASK